MAADMEVAMEREDAEFRAANERITAMAEELRKAELVRDRLEGLESIGRFHGVPIMHPPRVFRIPCCQRG